jgi:hypothetical protein
MTRRLGESIGDRALGVSKVALSFVGIAQVGGFTLVLSV